MFRVALSVWSVLKLRWLGARSLLKKIACSPLAHLFLPRIYPSRLLASEFCMQGLDPLLQFTHYAWRYFCNLNPSTDQLVRPL